MKELTIEEKAKLYDEAIERVVNIRTGKCETTFIFTEGLFNYLFPELEECNGEEVRKAMIDFFKHEREEGVTVLHYGVNIERMIAWLEKQKTSEEAIQYLKENHSPSEVSDFQTAMNIAVAKAYDKGVKDGLEKQGEQKPVGGEEDVAMLDSAIAFVEHSAFTTIGKDKNNVIDWLKSLKDRYTWKPSKEQILALRWVLNHIPYDSHKEEISGLLDQIKDL